MQRLTGLIANPPKTPIFHRSFTRSSALPIDSACATTATRDDDLFVLLQPSLDLRHHHSDPRTGRRRLALAHC